MSPLSWTLRGATRYSKSGTSSQIPPPSKSVPTRMERPYTKPGPTRSKPRETKAPPRATRPHLEHGGRRRAARERNGRGSNPGWSNSFDLVENDHERYRGRGGAPPPPRITVTVSEIAPRRYEHLAN